MGRPSLFVSTFLAVIAVSHAALTSELYWHAVFRNTPMPKAISDHLPRGGMEEKKIAMMTAMPDAAPEDDTGVILGADGRPITVDRSEKPFLYYPSPDSKSTANSYGRDGRIDHPMALGFFLEKDLRRGARIRMRFRRTMSGDTFLPRPAAESLPFCSAKLPEILSRFSIDPTSPETERILKALHHCEWPALRGEKKHCATSLESMIDFVAYSLGTREVRAMTTTSSSVAEPEDQVYTVLSWAREAISGTTSAVCHVPVYPYTVFHCHMMPESKPYRVRLAGEDGSAVEAAAMCHTNTSAYRGANTSPWDPMRRALNAFKVDPGTTLCHLIPDGDLLWVPVGAA